MNSKSWEGPIIGVCLSGFPTPVMFDPHTPIYNASKDGNVLITGSPGSGKSHAGMTLAMISALEGQQTVIVDPKGDEVGMSQLSGELGGHIDIWDLNEDEKKGSMDPFIIQPTVKSKVAKGTSLVQILVGNMSIDQKTNIQPIIEDVAAGENPSLTKLMTVLRGNAKPELRAIGMTLRAVKLSHKISNVIFADEQYDHTEKRKINDGLTIITMTSMPIPSRSKTLENYSNAERLSAGIMYLIMDFLYDMMTSKETKGLPKTILIDELWRVLVSEDGRSTTNSILRTDRSMNTSCILMTQSVSDIETIGKDGEINGSLLNNISTQFAFRYSDDSEEGGDARSEISNLCSSVGIPYTQYYSDSIQRLNPGECLMKDFMGRKSFIRFIQQSERWSDAFETNPKKRLMIAKRKAMEQAALEAGN